MTHQYFKNSAIWVSLLLSSFLTTPASAQNVLSVDPITVEAPALPMPGIASYPAGLDAAALPYTDGGDYLHNLPGVTAARMGGHGLEPFIRGQSEGQLNIVNDGSYTFGGCPNRMDPPSAYINLLPRDEIEIVRGYQSVLNGFGGSGGSVIVTKNPPDFVGDALSYEGLVQGGYESNGHMWNTGANAIAGTAQGYARGYASYKDSGNYDDGDGNAVRAAFTEKSGGLRFGYTPQDTHVYAGIDHHRIDDALFPGASMDSPLSEGQTFKAGIEHAVNGPVMQNIKIGAYASLVDHVMDNYSLRPFTASTAMRVDSDSDTYGLNLQSDMTVAGWPIEARVEWRHNNREALRYSGASVSNVNTVQSLLWPDIGIDEAALALETIYDLNLTTRLVAGGRYDFVHVDYGRANEAAPGAGNRTPNDVYTQFYGVTADSENEHNLGGLLRLEHDYGSDTTVYAGISRAVRTADATERGLASYMGAGGATSWVGNPDIAPEKHHQIDAGFDITKSDWTLGGSVYANYVDDYILRDSARRKTAFSLISRMPMSTGTSTLSSAGSRYMASGASRRTGAHMAMRPSPMARISTSTRPCRKSLRYRERLDSHGRRSSIWSWTEPCAGRWSKPA